MRLEQLALAAAPELGLSAVRSMVAMGVDVVALMGRVNQSGRVQRALQAIATIQGVDPDGNYRLKYLYRADGEQPAQIFEQVFQQMQASESK